MTFFDLQRKPGSRHSVSYSIAYVRVCEWVKEPREYERPKQEILEKAKAHAVRLGDHYILEKIWECEQHYHKVDTTVTPKRPGRTSLAEQISKEVTLAVREPTQPYSQLLLSKQERLDMELDEFIRDLNSMGL